MFLSQNHNFDAVACQIGYYHLIDIMPNAVKGTAFDGLEAIFQGSWAKILRAIETAEKRGCGVLIGRLFSQKSSVYL